MIPILYEANLSNAGILTNGICRLADCTSCVVTEERNGEFTLSLKMPMKGRYAAELTVDRIIKAAANDASRAICTAYINRMSPISSRIRTGTREPCQ